MTEAEKDRLIESCGGFAEVCRKYSLEDWRKDVRNNCTDSGYWEWVALRADADRPQSTRTMFAFLDKATEDFLEDARTGAVIVTGLEEEREGYLRVPVRVTVTVLR